MELTRIRETDVLSVMLQELLREGQQLKPWMADERILWIARCKQLLAAVPDTMQRFAWQMLLAQSLACTLEGCPVPLIMQELT